MESVIALLCLTGILIAHIVAVARREARYQQTIDVLTNKLMAKDYKEYVSMQPQEAEKEEPKKKTKLSWYDDEHDEEEAVN